MSNIEQVWLLYLWRHDTYHDYRQGRFFSSGLFTVHSINTKELPHFYQEITLHEKSLENRLRFKNLFKKDKTSSDKNWAALLP